jgi:hypothetical protein
MWYGVLCSLLCSIPLNYIGLVGHIFHAICLANRAEVMQDFSNCIECGMLFRADDIRRIHVSVYGNAGEKEPGTGAAIPLS